MRERSTWIDSVFATAFVFLLMWGFAEFFVSIEILDPIGEAIGDVEVTDVVFSQLRTDEPIPDERVVLVNIGTLDRLGIAEQIRILNKYNPKAIGIDVRFFKPKANEVDSVFARSMSEVKNMVLASKLDSFNLVTNQFDTVFMPEKRFVPYSTPAFANFVTSAGEQDEFKAVRTFAPAMEVDGEWHYALAVQLAKYYDSVAVKDFLARNKEVEVINFTRNVLAGNSYFSNQYPALDVADVFTENFTPEMIEGKIVFMGFMGEYFGDTSWDDKFFTPLNQQYAGRTNPDMFGLVVHANIISMILDRNYINTMSSTLGIIIGIVLCWVNVFCFILIYKNLGRWYDGLSKLIQLIEAIILVIIIGMVFNGYNYKLDLTLGIAAVALSGDSLEVYFGVVKNLFSAEGRKELFNLKG